MRTVTIHLRDKEYHHFIELVRNLQYIQKIDLDGDDEPNKAEIVKNLRQGFKEMQLIQQGKLKTTSLTDFLNEL